MKTIQEVKALIKLLSPEQQAALWSLQKVFEARKEEEERNEINEGVSLSRGASAQH